MTGLARTARAWLSTIVILQLVATLVHGYAGINDGMSCNVGSAGLDTSEYPCVKTLAVDAHLLLFQEQRMIHKATYLPHRITWVASNCSTSLLYTHRLGPPTD